jgi:hypothetical protein
VAGKADLIEEIARIYGYERIPETQIADRLPPQHGNPDLEGEERVRDLLVDLGLQEVVTYRLTSPEREALRLAPGTPPDEMPYVRVANPIAGDRVVMRHSLLASVMEVVERNSRIRPRMALFEIGAVYLASEAGSLPEEPRRLAIVLTGPRSLPAWQAPDSTPMDFFDLKGVVDGLLRGMGLEAVRYEADAHPSFHPGKAARVWAGDRQLGVLGEMHPLVVERYDLPATPVLAADLDVEAILAGRPARRVVRPVAAFPPVLEDIAVIVDENTKAVQVRERSVGRRLDGERGECFDLYRGDSVGPGLEEPGLFYHLHGARPHPDRRGSRPGEGTHRAATQSRSRGPPARLSPNKKPGKSLPGFRFYRPGNSDGAGRLGARLRALDGHRSELGHDGEKVAVGVGEIRVRGLVERLDHPQHPLPIDERHAGHRTSVKLEPLVNRRGEPGVGPHVTDHHRLAVLGDPAGDPLVPRDAITGQL